MEATYTTKAVVLKREPFRECDARITVYSEEQGKLDLVVRGVKKAGSKLAGHIEPFNLVGLMVIRGKQYDYVGTAVNADFFYNLKTDLEKIKAAGAVLGRLERILKPGIQDTIIFDQISGFLSFLNTNQAIDVYKYELIANIFLLKIIIHLGYQPELFHCVGCSKKLSAKGNVFSFRQGGIACADCGYNKEGGDLTISENAIKILRMADAGYGELAKLKISLSLAKEVNNIINLFFKYHFQ